MPTVRMRAPAAMQRWTMRLGVVDGALGVLLMVASLRSVLVG
jgi:hypothetical protein